MGNRHDRDRPRARAARSLERATVWAACFADVPALPEPWLACLDEAERHTLARFKHPRAAISYAGRHAMAREILGTMVGRPPATLRFAPGPFGKPAILPEGTTRPPFFNLSRAGEAALLATHPLTEIGVDMEYVDAAGLAVARLFSQPEQEMLAGLDVCDRPLAFYRFWVSKEAALKAAGTGLSIPPDRVTITWEGASGDRGRATLLVAGRPDYHVRLFPMPSGAVAAVATARPVDVSLQWWRRCHRRAACSACTTSLIA